jgi:predicted CXXCH cytochrome family protein
MAAVSVSLGQHGTGEQKEICLACHEDVEVDLNGAVPHPPAEDGQCTACHNPHVSRFSGLLRERPGPVCFQCHSDVQEKVEGRAVVHPPAEEGRCAACHQPHGGSRAGLLTATGEELCRSCHDAVADWTGLPAQHSPFTQGKCGRCHDPHGSDHDGLTRGNRKDLCGGCHPVTQAFKAAHKGYPVETGACEQCHDPHAAPAAGLLRRNLHAPFVDGECTTCHPLPGSAEPFRPKLAVQELCGICHDDRVQASQQVLFSHLGGEAGKCTVCHNPHTASGDALLKGTQQSLCMTCHDPGGAGSGAEGRYSTHASDLECSTCHSPHGGDRPLMLVSEPVELCAQCHAAEHSIAHPMGEDSRDPRSEAPMDCLSCHGIHDAPFPKYLELAGDKDLCLSCHRNLAGGP